MKSKLIHCLLPFINWWESQNCIKYSTFNIRRNYQRSSQLLSKTEKMWQQKNLTVLREIFPEGNSDEILYIHKIMSEILEWVFLFECRRVLRIDELSSCINWKCNRKFCFPIFLMLISGYRVLGNVKTNFQVFSHFLQKCSRVFHTRSEIAWMRENCKLFWWKFSLWVQEKFIWSHVLFEFLEFSSPTKQTMPGIKSCWVTNSALDQNVINWTNMLWMETKLWKHFQCFRFTTNTQKGFPETPDVLFLGHCPTHSGFCNFLAFN